MKHKRDAAAAAAAFVLTLCLCLFLSHADNKYTRPGPQPISGVLYLTEAQLADDTVHYPIREWVFTPDKLLSPAEAASPSGYRQYVDIGSGRMAHGSGTYALTLMLPEAEAQYALELPEVFSACTLFVDGEPVLKMGDPSPEGYAEAIGSQVVSFAAAGETTLLLQVRDLSGVYSGLTFPPAFGSLPAVLSAREGRLLLHSVGVLLALVGAFLALSFGIRENQRRGFLAALAGLCLAVSTGYPLVHGLLRTAFQPWYTLEAVCYYALLLLAVLLQIPSRWPPLRKALLALPCGLGVLGALARFGAASLWPAAAGTAFSWLFLGVKYYAAACLMALSIQSIRRGSQRSVLPLCGSAALAACLLADRLIPLYEPICGGWFAELGGVLLVVFLGASLWLDAMDAYRFRVTYQEGYRQMERRLELQKEHYSQLTEQIQRSREASHDLRHHMRAIRSLADQGKRRELIAYLDAYEPHAADREVQIWCGNPTADAVLGYYAAEAKKLGAVYDVQMALPAQLPFPEDLLCIVLGNLLENAVDAMARQTDGQRSLYLRGDLEQDRLRLVVDNSFDGVLRMREDRFLSTKHRGVGLGISSVESIVSRYGGLADFSARQNTFHVSLLIPLQH